MSFNNSGIQLFVDETYNLWDYLAFGSGVVADNDNSLETETDRVDAPVSFKGTNYFELQFTIDESTGNGSVIREYGVAPADTSDINSTSNYAPIEKNALVYVLVSLKLFIKNVV